MSEPMVPGPMVPGVAPFEALFALLDRLPVPVRRAMVGMYRQLLVEQIDQLGAALREGELPTQQALAHKTAGSAAMMQDRALADALLALGTALHKVDPAGVAAAWGRVGLQAARSLEALAREDAAAPDPAQPMSP